jgi:hypothetical protein
MISSNDSFRLPLEKGKKKKKQLQKENELLTVRSVKG